MAFCRFNSANFKSVSSTCAPNSAVIASTKPADTSPGIDVGVDPVAAAAAAAVSGVANAIRTGVIAGGWADMVWMVFLRRVGRVGLELIGVCCVARSQFYARCHFVLLPKIRFLN